MDFRSTVFGPSPGGENQTQTEQQTGSFIPEKDGFNIGYIALICLGALVVIFVIGYLIVKVRRKIDVVSSAQSHINSRQSDVETVKPEIP